MSGFDPSAIQDIGQQPDYGGAVAKGFQLKDLVDQNQMNKLRLNSLKSEQSDNQKAKSILSTSDLQTQRGISEAAVKLKEAGLPEKGMDLYKYGQSVATGEVELQRQKVDLHVQSQNLITDKVDGLWAAATQMKEAKLPDGRPKYTDASINAFIQGQVPGMINDIQTSELPDPVKQTALGGITPILQKTGGKITYDQLTQFEQQSKKGLEQIRQHQQDLLGQRKEVTAERSEAERERHDQSMESLGQQKFQASKDSKGNLDDKTLQYLANQYLAGDKSVFQNLGRGKQGATDIANLRKAVVDRATELGISPQETAAKLAEFGGLQAGERAAGTRQAQVSMAGNEAYNMINLARQASDAVPRGSFVPLTKAEQAAKTAGSDPALAKFVAANTSLVNAYARAISPTGQPHDSDKEHARQMLNTAQSKEAYNAVLGQMQSEIEAAKQAPAQVQKELKQGVTGEKPTSSGPAKVASDADYEKLPSGTQFVAPDGTTRTKP